MSENTLTISGIEILPRKYHQIDLPLPPLYTDTPLTMPVHVFSGSPGGPNVFVSAALHGDELNGIEIVRRLVKRLSVKNLTGTVIAVPAVNIYGMIQRSRYMPDRRDLNRCFPGTSSGSLSGRFAHLFMEEIVSKCSIGIDLHTGANNRDNVPQIRANIEDLEVAELARAFSVPVIINSKLPDGSLRGAGKDQGVRIIVYEAGEAMRYNEVCIRMGLNGILNTLKFLKMLPQDTKVKGKLHEPSIAKSSSWTRATMSGIFRSKASLGKHVTAGQTLGVIEDVGGINKPERVKVKNNGIVIGKSHTPLVYEGDPLFHIAYFENVEEVAANISPMEDQLSNDTFITEG